MVPAFHVRIKLVFYSEYRGAPLLWIQSVNMILSSLRIFILFFALSITLGPSFSYAQSAFDDPQAPTAKGGSGDLSPLSKSVDAGEVALGSTSQVLMLFRNDSGQELSTGAINLYPSSNVSASIEQNQCVGQPLQPAEVCAIAFAVKGLQRGNFRIEVLMRHEGVSKLLVTTITGSIEATDDQARELLSDVEAIPTELDFGSLNESRPLVRSVILRNITSKPIDVKDVVIEANPQSGFALKHNCSQLESGQACLGTITWAPEQRGPATGVLAVEHTGPTGLTSVTLDGSYEPDTAAEAEVFPEAVPGKGLLVSSQSEIDFGGGIETSSAITVSLVNVGDAPVILEDIRLSNDENGILLSKSGCIAGTVLEPIEACPLTVTWEPTREGDIIDDIQVVHNGARGILVLPVRGQAAQAVNKDKKAIFFDAGGVESILRNIPPVSTRDLQIEEEGQQVAAAQQATEGEEDSEVGEQTEENERAEVPVTPQIDLRGALDGYTITSYASNRAIVSGPGGSRVIFDGEQTVIGGVLWEVNIKPSAVQFRNGEQKVLLLFDRSLSSVNPVSGQSSSSSTSDN